MFKNNFFYFIFHIVFRYKNDKTINMIECRNDIEIKENVREKHKKSFK